MNDAAIVGLGPGGGPGLGGGGEGETARSPPAPPRAPARGRGFGAPAPPQPPANLGGARGAAGPPGGGPGRPGPPPTPPSPRRRRRGGGRGEGVEPDPGAGPRGPRAAPPPRGGGGGGGGGEGHFPAMAELARLVAGGARPYPHIEANFSNEGGEDVLALAGSPDESPGGGMTGTGIHVLDAMMPVRRAGARPDRHDPQLEFRSGISGVLAAVRSTPGVLAAPCLWPRRLGRGARPNWCSAEAATSRRHLPPVDLVRANLDAFADAVAGVAPYPIAPSEMVDVVAAFEAIAKAAPAAGLGRDF